MMIKRWTMILLLVTALVACSRSHAPTPTPLVPTPSPTAGPRFGGGGVVASGEVVPALEAHLSFTTPGLVEAVAVSEGDRVQPGQVLITLEARLLQAQVTVAQAVLDAAQAQLALLNAGPRPQDLAAAQAQVAAAQAALAQAVAQRDQPEVGATEAEVRAAQSEVSATQADQLEAERTHDMTMKCVQVTLPGGEEQKICPALGPYEELARYTLLTADGAQAAAQARLDALLAGADAEVRAAQAGVAAAAAGRDGAQAQLEMLREGARAEEVAVAETAVAQAQAALVAAQAALEQATLCAPFAGTVVSLAASTGEAVLPGQAVLTLADLEHLEVETTDLSERDVVRVAAGQAATVYVEALGAEIGGRVGRIAPQATAIGGDVVYAVVIALDGQPSGLRWGMTVQAEIAAPTPTAEVPAAAESGAGGSTVSASGEVVPAQEARLGFPIPGRVQAVAIEEGEAVQEDQALVTLETGLLEASVAQAQAACASARAQLNLLKAGPRPQEVAAARARVQAAQALLAQAAARRDQLTTGATQAQVAAAQAQLATAQTEEQAARWACEQVQGQQVEEWKKEAALLRLRAAELARAAAEAQLAQAQQSAEVQVRAANAAVQAAEAQRDGAQAQLEWLQAGASAEEIAAAQAAVAQAEGTLQAAQAALDQATLRAPFAGTVTSVVANVGETVMPGQMVAVLADLTHLQVETTDLGEQDVARVKVGQPAAVYVEALGVEVGGQVVDVAQEARTVGGDVVYRVVIVLDEQPTGLRCRMSVEVEIAAE